LLTCLFYYVTLRHICRRLRLRFDYFRQRAGCCWRFSLLRADAADTPALILLPVLKASVTKRRCRYFSLDAAAIMAPLMLILLFRLLRLRLIQRDYALARAVAATRARYARC